MSATDAPPQPTRLPAPVALFDHMWPEDTMPLVTIICPTYNHQDFIEQCLDSFLAQKTSFPVEILVHDDASTDRTAEILRAYQAKFPGIVSPVIQKENQMQIGNKMMPVLVRMARSKYVALCEGDDFWVTADKLQQQVDVMVANPDVTLCYHSNVEVDEVGRHLPTRPPREKFEIFDQGEFIRGTFGDLTTASVLYRRSLIEHLPSWYLDLPFGDINLYALASIRGRIAVIPGVHSVYRRHQGGMYNQSRLAEDEMKYFSKELWWRQAICDLFAHLENETSDRALRRLCRQRACKEHMEAAWFARLAGSPQKLLQHVMDAAKADWTGVVATGKWWKSLLFGLLPMLDVNLLEHQEQYRERRKTFLSHFSQSA